jgi:hypothetical protein
MARLLTPPHRFRWFAEQRSSARHRISGIHLHLEWWEGSIAYESAACLIDISRSGARLAAKIPPRLHQQVRLRLDRPGGNEWLGATVIRRQGLGEVGLAFRDVGPEDFRKLLTLDCRYVECP